MRRRAGPLQIHERETAAYKEIEKQEVLNTCRFQPREDMH